MENKINYSGSAPLKIGFVLDDSLDTADGVQQYILTLGAWMRSQGHDVHYLVGQTERTDLPGIHSLSRNVKVKFNQNRMSIPLPASKSAITQLLTREQFDVLHVQLPYSPFLAGRIIAAAPKATAIIGSFHIAPYSPFVAAANSTLSIALRRTLKRFDSIISVSPVAQAFAKKTFGIKSQVIPNTVNLDPYMSAAALPQYKNELTILFLGRLVERKGCQYLLKAITELQSRKSVKTPYKVIICGKGELEEQLRQYTYRHNLDDVIEFIGFVDESDKPRFMASSDIAIFPSTGGESFGIVLIEAMAASRGVVMAGNNPGYASVMADHTGALFDPFNTSQLADKLEEFLNNPGTRAKARDWQKHTVQQYGVSVVGRQIIDVYTTALRKHRS